MAVLLCNTNLSYPVVYLCTGTHGHVPVLKIFPVNYCGWGDSGRSDTWMAGQKMQLSIFESFNIVNKRPAIERQSSEVHVHVSCVVCMSMST